MTPMTQTEVQHLEHALDGALTTTEPWASHLMQRGGTIGARRWVGVAQEWSPACLQIPAGELTSEIVQVLQRVPAELTRAISAGAAWKARWGRQGVALTLYLDTVGVQS